MIKTHLQQYTSPETDNILRNTYVDNIILSTLYQRQILKHYQALKLIFNNAKMNIRQFSTNSTYGYNNIRVEDRDTNDEISVLGIYWKPHTDVIKINFKSWKGQPGTKRNILSFIASQFDPLGLISPTTLPLRKFCQKLWEQNYKWDELLGSTLMKEWNRLVKPFGLAQLIFDRQVLPHGNWGLHVFTDASKDGYAAIVYATVKVENTAF